MCQCTQCDYQVLFQKIKKNLLNRKLTKKTKCSDGVDFNPGDEIEDRSGQKNQEN